MNFIGLILFKIKSLYGVRSKKPSNFLLNQVELILRQGNLLEDSGDLRGALDKYQSAIEILPNHALAYLNIGNVYLSQDNLNQAIDAYGRAIICDGRLASAHFNMGNAKALAGQLTEAIRAYETAIDLSPSFVDAWVGLANVQGDLKNWDEAIKFYKKALELKPDYFGVYLNLGNLYRSRGRFSEAMECFNSLLAIQRKEPELYRSMGLVYRGMDKMDDAIKCFESAIELNPNYVLALIDIANTYRELGNIKLATNFAKRARDADRDDPGAWSLLLFCLSDSEGVGKETLFSEHGYFGKHFERNALPRKERHNNLVDENRMLKVGFVSGDLRNHAVANFVSPVLKSLRRRDDVYICIYETGGLEDDITRDIKSMVNCWREVEAMSVSALSNLVCEDEIDILVDLSGHTPAHRLLTFAQKPAPVQMSWIGYPGTTGLQSMDYYIGDKYFLPLGEFDDYFSEKIIRIPANAPFLPSVFSPDVNCLPALRNGYITFASFNRLDKIGREVVSLWSNLLHNVPDSKMIIAGMPIDREPEQLIGWFDSEGVSRDRLLFHKRSGMRRYLELHHEVDICLDTFPYGGGTTTCHAAWMGVPTITLVGDTPASCVGRAVMSHLGLQEKFCAHDKSKYLELGMWCANNFEELQILRNNLRTNLQSSPLSQANVVADGLNMAFRYAWKRWCADLPPISFEVVQENHALYVSSSEVAPEFRSS